MEKFYVYVVLTRTNTVISRLIQLFKKDEFTHAAISLDRDLANMYSFGRKYTFNPFIGVFKHENLNKGTYKYCKVLPGAVIELEVTKQQYQRAKALLQCFISNAGRYKYNYMGLVNGLLNREACHDSRFGSTEAMMAAMMTVCNPGTKWWSFPRFMKITPQTPYFQGQSLYMCIYDHLDSILMWMNWKKLLNRGPKR